jgi:hypothetical protein
VVARPDDGAMIRPDCEVGVIRLDHEAVRVRVARWWSARMVGSRILGSRILGKGRSDGGAGIRSGREAVRVRMVGSRILGKGRSDGEAVAPESASEPASKQH